MRPAGGWLLGSSARRAAGASLELSAESAKNIFGKDLERWQYVTLFFKTINSV